MKAKHLLLTDDDYQFGIALQAYLDALGYRVTYCQNAADTLSMLDNIKPDLLVLDLSLPDEDGLCLLRKLRYSQQLPVIIISGRTDIDDRVASLELGADDYLVKPFSPRELSLRIERRLALTAQHQNPVKATVLQFGDWRLDIEAHDLQDQEGKVQPLTPSEFQILKLLASNPNKVYSRQQLLDSCLKLETAESERAVDISISRLRKKIEQDSRTPKLLITVRNFGYKLVV
ncbi:response regulator transcription factor [Rheinheimera sp. UJ51]|uniref:response regulator transcription factor n=1 Tax=unclassified Rheinheimera TaxID=115860 RepID=UPI001E34FF2D|nr:MULTISPECIES: response regulator transcription factor [unclassified Rheinheimera]MCC5451828.1 response regulator transcription factor [Rheinheimera sp. UJ51]MCF4009564.1 response regulator transcription factor [Rheinheimera sp. UJ63]